MTDQETRFSQPKDAARHIYAVFNTLFERGMAASRRQIDLSSPEMIASRQDMLLDVRELIQTTSASPYYKAKISREMFDSDGEYRGGPFLDAASLYFGISDDDDLGIFDKQSAATFEALAILRESQLLVTQATLDSNVFTLAMQAAQNGKDQLREWVESYDTYHDKPLLSFLNSIHMNASDEIKPDLERDIRRLKALLTDYTEEEK